MNKLILLFVIILNLSCSNNKSEVGDGLPYFQFTQADSDKFINSTEVGKILIYKSQNNEEIKFKVIRNKTEKKLESRGTFVGSYSYQYFYYDEQRIQFGDINKEPSEYFDSATTFYVSVRRYPTLFQTSPTVISKESIIFASVQLHLFDNSETAVIKYNEPVINLTINSSIYTKVRKISLAQNPNPNPIWQLPSLKFIYFDQNKGLIGFDDIQNNEWRLQN